MRTLADGTKQVLRWGGNWEGGGWNYDGTIDKGVSNTHDYADLGEEPFALFGDYYNIADDVSGVFVDTVDEEPNDKKRKASGGLEMQPAKKKKKRPAARK